MSGSWGATCGPVGGGATEEGTADDEPEPGGTDVEAADTGSGARGAPASTSSVSASFSAVSGPSAWAEVTASIATMRARTTVAPRSRPRMAPPFVCRPPAPSRPVGQAVLGASVRPASPQGVQKCSPISPAEGALIRSWSSLRGGALKRRVQFLSADPGVQRARPSAGWQRALSIGGLEGATGQRPTALRPAA
jgi:hypothetical protein